MIRPRLIVYKTASYRQWRQYQSIQCLFNYEQIPRRRFVAVCARLDLAGQEEALLHASLQARWILHSNVPTIDRQKISPTGLLISLFAPVATQNSPE